jgi:DUF971 family protein
MPMPRLIIPIEEDNLLRILWDDDDLSSYPFAYLRGWCPCAACQGHGAERHFVTVTDPKLVGISRVGNYALSPRWEDGHETGIYSFEYLRELSARLKGEDIAKG